MGQLTVIFHGRREIVVQQVWLGGRRVSRLRRRESGVQRCRCCAQRKAREVYACVKWRSICHDNNTLENRPNIAECREYVVAISEDTIECA